jgi:hypothetical protein
MPPPPAQPKIYHIVHVDRLASMLAERGTPAIDFEP